MIADMHIHSLFSTDSDTPMESMVQAAVKAGIPTICFTDHIDYDYPVKDITFEFDIGRYKEAIDALKEKYKSKILILMGVELGLQEHLGGRYRKLVEGYPFDFIIGSQHLVGNKDPYYSETFEGRTDMEIYREFFKETLRDIKAFHDFDSMGHLDYIVRYGRKKAADYRYRDYADIIDEILKLLIRYNISLELNTAGIRKQLGFPNPHPEILKRYRELGGTCVTVGSDSHKPHSLGYAFDEAADILKDCGFTHYVYYVQRKAHFVKL